MFSHSCCYAAIYPEAVAIAGLLASPTWRAKGTAPFGDPDTDDRWDLCEQFGLRLGLPEYCGLGGAGSIPACAVIASRAG